LKTLNIKQNSKSHKILNLEDLIYEENRRWNLVGLYYPFHMKNAYTFFLMAHSYIRM
jgi:hypothetical protein